MRPALIALAVLGLAACARRDIRPPEPAPGQVVQYPAPAVEAPYRPWIGGGWLRN